MLIWRRITGSQSSGKNFTLFSALWMGSVMMPKSKIWLASRLWPSTCQLLRGTYMVPELHHPACHCWEERSSLGWKTPGWPRITRKCRGRKLLHWPSFSSGAPFGLVPLQMYSVEQYKSSTSASLLWWRKATCSICRKIYGRGLGRTPWLPLPPKKSPTEKSPFTDAWRGGAYLLYFMWPSNHDQPRRGGAFWGPDPGAKKAATTPWVFFHGPNWTCNATFRRCIPAGSCDLVGPLCTRDDHLTHPSNGWGPLPPSGLELYQDVPSEHFLPGTTGTLPKGQKTLSDYNSPLYHGNTSAKHWPKQIPTLPLKWVLDWVYTHSPNEVNFRIEGIPTLNQRKWFKSINWS